MVYLDKVTEQRQANHLTESSNNLHAQVLKAAAQGSIVVINIPRLRGIKILFEQADFFRKGVYNIWLNSSLSPSGPVILKYRQPFFQKGRKTGAASITLNPASFN